MTTSKHCFITDALTSCIEIFIDDKFLKEFFIILYFLKQEISSVDNIWKDFCTAQIGHYAHTFWIKETMAKKDFYCDYSFNLPNIWTKEIGSKTSFNLMPVPWFPCLQEVLKNVQKCSVVDDYHVLYMSIPTGALHNTNFRFNWIQVPRVT